MDDRNDARNGAAGDGTGAVARRASGSVLAVDDRPENLRLLMDGLEASGYKVRIAPSGAFALRAIETELPEIILLDVAMPGMDGYEVCRRLKASERTREIPVIFVSAANEVADKVRGFEVGGVDFVTKPFQFDEVEARIRTHLELRRARAELAQSYARLQALEQLRDDMTRLLVHDMRSPVGAMLGSLQMLRAALERRGGAVDELTDVDLTIRSAGSLFRMVNDLLDASRLEAGQLPLKRRRCDARAIVDEAVLALRGLAPERVPRVAGGPVWGEWDPELIRRVVENLVANALKFTPRDRRVWLEIAGGEELTVRVCDEGPGVDPAVKQRIFEKFVTSPVDPPGRIPSAGLGLYFCRLAVEAHGGRIGVESEPGRGSAFWFSLPMAPPEPA